MNSILFNTLSKKNKSIEVICPCCGEKNDILNIKCRKCSFDLEETKSRLYSHFVYFNNAIKFNNEKKFLEGFESICKYLAYEGNDEDAYKIYIYFLVKLNNKEKAERELVNFEKRFPRNPWILLVEDKGISNIEFPKCDKKNINFETNKMQLNLLNKDFINNHIRSINELTNLAIQFYSIIYANRDNYKLFIQLNTFFNKILLPALSKREISVEIFERKNIDSLSNEDMLNVDVKGTIQSKKISDGTIITISPGIYIRSLLLKKQQILVVSNKKRKKLNNLEKCENNK